MKQSPAPLTPDDEARLLDGLAYMGETHQSTIAETLEACRNDTKALAFWLDWRSWVKGPDRRMTENTVGRSDD